MRIGFRRNDPFHAKRLVLSICVILIPLTGCAVTPMETHRKGMEGLTEKEYFIPQKPVDRAFIGCAWSKQFGPIENPAADDIRTKMDRSFDSMQQNFAYRIGVSLGGQSTLGGKSTKGALQNWVLKVDRVESPSLKTFKLLVLSPWRISPSK